MRKIVSATIDAMLLNEFLKEHRKVEELEKAMAAQQQAVRTQQEEIAALSAKLRD